MALTGLVLTTLLNTFPQAEPTLACTFPDRQDETAPITLKVEHHPSLFDLGPNFQVDLVLSSVGHFDAAAGPEPDSADWAVVIRGVREDRQLALALKTDGTAIMRLVADDTQKQTRVGHCQGHEDLLRRWTS